MSVGADLERNSEFPRTPEMIESELEIHRMLAEKQKKRRRQRRS